MLIFSLHKCWYKFFNISVDAFAVALGNILACESKIFVITSYLNITFNTAILLYSGK